MNTSKTKIITFEIDHVVASIGLEDEWKKISVTMCVSKWQLIGQSLTLHLSLHYFYIFSQCDCLHGVIPSYLIGKKSPFMFLGPNPDGMVPI